MNKAIIIGFVGTVAAMASGFEIPQTWEWYYFPVLIALGVATGAVIRTLKEMAK